MGTAGIKYHSKLAGGGKRKGPPGLEGQMELQDAILKIAGGFEPPVSIEYAIVDGDNLLPQYDYTYSTLAEAQSHCTPGDYVIAIENGVERMLSKDELTSSKQTTLESRRAASLRP